MGLCQTKKQIITDTQKTDQRLRQSILAMPIQESDIKHPELYCPNAFPVSCMCISKSCQYDSLMCENQECPSCASRHTSCGQIKMHVITKLVEDRSKQHHQLIHKIDEIQSRIFSSLSVRRQVYLQKFFLRGFDKRYLNIIQSLFFEGEQFSFNGAQAEEFYQKLKQSNAEIENIEGQVLRHFNRQIERIAASMTLLQGEVINQFITKCKMQLEKIKTQIDPTDCQMVLDSTILPEDRQEDVKFIFENLDWPKQIQLLFRGSEHNFSGPKFHSICDNIPHTLTIIKTQYQKVIAGYTPLTWNITKGMAADESKSSFLLSIDQKQKMSLLRPEKAIQCIASEGPVFGGGCDLAVTNNCHINITSCTNFPFSYNFQGKYKYNQDSWRTLCGVPSGKVFRILQYQVYKVIW